MLLFQTLNSNKKDKEDNGEEIKPKIEKIYERLTTKNFKDKDSDITTVFNEFYRLGSSFKCDRRTKLKKLPSTLRNHIDLYKRKSRQIYAYKPVDDLEQELAEDWRTPKLKQGECDRTNTPCIEYDNKFGELSEVEDVISDCSESVDLLERDKEVQEEKVSENLLEKSIRGSGNEGADAAKPIGKKTCDCGKKVDSEGRQRDPDDSRGDEMKPVKDRNSTEQGPTKVKKERRKWRFWKRHKNRGESAKDNNKGNNDILQENRGVEVECEDDMLFQRLYERIMKQIETEKRSAIAKVEDYNKYKLICDDLMRTMSKGNASAADCRGAEPKAEPVQRKMPTGNGQLECRKPMSKSTSDGIGRGRSKTAREADDENLRRSYDVINPDFPTSDDANGYEKECRINTDGDKLFASTKYESGRVEKNKEETKNSSGNNIAYRKCEKNKRHSDQSKNDEFSNKKCKHGDEIGKCGKERNDNRKRVGRTLNDSFEVEGNGSKRCLGDSSKSSERNMTDSCIGVEKSGYQQETDKCSKLNRDANGESLLSRKARDFSSSSDDNVCDSDTDGGSKDSSSVYDDDPSEECSDHVDSSSDECSDSDVEYAAGRDERRDLREDDDNTRSHYDCHDRNTPILTKVKMMERQAPPTAGDEYTIVKSDNELSENRKLNGANERVTRKVRNTNVGRNVCDEEKPERRRAPEIVEDVDNKINISKGDSEQCRLDGHCDKSTMDQVRCNDDATLKPNRKNYRDGNDTAFKRMSVEPSPRDGNEFENQTLQMKNRNICRERAMDMKSKQFEDIIRSELATKTVKEEEMNVCLDKKEKSDSTEDEALPGKKSKKSCKQRSREKKIRKYLEYIERNIKLLGSDSRRDLVKNYDLDNRLKVLTDGKLSPKPPGDDSQEIRQRSKSRQNVENFENESAMVNETRENAPDEVSKENYLEKYDNIKVERKKRKPCRKKSEEKMMNKSSECVDKEICGDFVDRATGRKLPATKVDSRDLFIKTQKEKKAKKISKKERCQQKKLRKCLEIIEKNRHLMEDYGTCESKTEKIHRATSYDDMTDEGSTIPKDDVAIKHSQPQIYEEIRPRKCKSSRPEGGDSTFDKINKIPTKMIIDKHEEAIVRDRKMCEQKYSGAKRSDDNKKEQVRQDSDNESQDEEVVHRTKWVEDRVEPKRCGYSLKLKSRLDDSTSVLSRVKMGRSNNSESYSDSDDDTKTNYDKPPSVRDKRSSRDHEKQTDRHRNSTNETRPMCHERLRGQMDRAVGNTKDETSKDSGDVNRERFGRKFNRPNEETKGRCVADERCSPVKSGILINNGRRCSENVVQKRIKMSEKARMEDESGADAKKCLDDLTRSGPKSPSLIAIRNGSSCVKDDVESKSPSPLKKNDDNKHGFKDCKISYKKEMDKNIKPVNCSSDKYYRKDNRRRPCINCPVCDNVKTFSGRGRKEDGCKTVRSDSDDHKADRCVDREPTKDRNDARKRIDQACDARRFKIYEFSSQNVLFAIKNSIDLNGTDIKKTLNDDSELVKRTDVGAIQVKESHSERIGCRFNGHSNDGHTDGHRKDILMVVYSRCDNSKNNSSDHVLIKDDSKLRRLLKTTIDNDLGLYSTNNISDCSSGDVEFGKERSDDDIEAYLRTRFKLSRSEVSFRRIDRFDLKRRQENSPLSSADKNPSDPRISDNIRYKIFKFIDKRNHKKKGESDKKIKLIRRKRKIYDEDKSKKILNVKTNDELFLKWIEYVRNQKLKKIRRRKEKKVEEWGTKHQFSSSVDFDQKKESEPAELKSDEQPTMERKKMSSKTDAPFGSNLDEDSIKISKEDCDRLEDEGEHGSSLKNDEQCKKDNEFIEGEHLMKSNDVCQKDDAKFTNKEYDIDEVGPVEDRMRDSGATITDIFNNPISDNSRSVYSRNLNSINSGAGADELECEVTQDSSSNNRTKEENTGNKNLELKESESSLNIIDSTADAEVQTVCHLWNDGDVEKSVRDEVKVGYFNQVQLNDNLGNFENLNRCHSEKKQPGGDNILNLSQCDKSNIESVVCKNLGIVSTPNKNNAVKLNKKYRFYRLFDMPPKNDSDSTDGEGILPEGKRSKKRCRTRRDLKKDRSIIRNGSHDLSSECDDSEHETSDSDRDGGKAPEKMGSAETKRNPSADSDEDEVAWATLDVVQPERNYDKRDTGQEGDKKMITTSIEPVSSRGETFSKLDIITDKLKLNVNTNELKTGSKVCTGSGDRKFYHNRRTDKGTIDKSAIDKGTIYNGAIDKDAIDKRGDREMKKMLRMVRIKKRLKSKAYDDLTSGINYFKMISHEFISVYKLPKLRKDFICGHKRHFDWGIKLKVNQCYINTDNVNFDDVKRGW